MKLHPHPFSALFSLFISLATTSPTEPDPIGQSPQIQDGLLVRAPTACPVVQDGLTSTTFPWTHAPTCLPLVLPVEPHGGRHGTYCVYTNAAFNDGRGISIVSSPESAAELAREVWETGVGRERAEGGLWEARDVEGKGVGLFAKRPIDSGETVILESPVVVVAREVLGSVSSSRRRVLLERAVGQLPERTREMVTALSRRGGESEVEDIVNVNAVGAKVWDGTSHLLVVPEAARINHACRPNAYYRFSDATLTLTVFALAPIPPGHELTFSYGFSLSPFSARTAALKETWGFTCTCPLCSSSPTNISLSDTRLADIAGLKTALPTSLEDIPQYIALIPRLVALLEEEGLYAELPMYEEILAYAWSAVGEEGRARAWAERAGVHWGIVAGKDSWEARRCEELAADVKGHYTWGTWEGDIWEAVGKGHPWDEREGDDHDHEH
ncbi:SET domain-containing protein [Karstenula rhodostoma CBS 690.94]|uniref:SET domain-containing protein n=1 Tax=Karstenula rhodostoma CBS 690.94 TaxID=1392251 RepID=A0A9P4P9K1_9PLEO|nr:SET domain-containing protein [Karstenula rhodostoma CBS 690.94]